MKTRAEATIPGRDKDRVALITEIATRLLGSDASDEVVQEVFVDLAAALQLDLLLRYDVELEGASLRLAAHAGVPGPMLASLARLRWGQGVCGTVAAELRPHSSDHVQSSSEPMLELVRSLGIRAYACYPLVTHRGLVGTLAFGSTLTDTFARNALNLMRTVANLLAVAADRHRAERELRESEARFRWVVENSHEGFYRRDLVTDTYDYLSPAMEPLFGFPLEELSTLPIEEVVGRIHPDDVEGVHQALKAASRTGRLYVEYRFRRKDGELRWIADSATTVQEQGRPAHLGGVIRDITEQKHAEEADLATRRSAEQLQLALDSAQQGTWDYDLAAGEVYWDRRAAPLFGLSTEQRIPYAKVIALIHEDDRAGVDAAVTRALDPAGDGAFQVEHRVICPDGSVHWLVGKGQAHFEGSGAERRAVRFAGIVMDVTERHATERALRASEESFRTMADAIPQLAWMTDEDGRVVWYNQRWFDFTGTTRDDLAGWHWQAMVHPDHGERVSEKVRRCFETGEVWEDTFPLQGKDGGYRWFLSRAVPIRDESGRVVRWFGTKTDVTEQREVEAALRESTIQLGEANRLKDEFLATLSHELRTPLNAVLGWSKMLATASLDAETTKRGMEAIARNAEAQAQLVADVLDVSRIVTGKLRLRVGQIDLVQVLQGALDAVLPAAQAKQLRVETRIAPGSTTVSGDADRLQQVLWNLMSNAVKFTPPGGRITVTMQRSDSHLVTRVADTGPGIEPAFLPHVFERFTQADTSTRRGHGGLGLGLALVRHLVELHGGTVAAESPGVGQGTTFTVRLPARAFDHPQVTPAEPALAAAAPEANASYSLEGLHVLVVDDQPDALELVSAVLRQRGAEVTTAADAATALQRLREGSCQVLLADIGMPDEDGYELIRKVRQDTDPMVRNVPSAALTAYSRGEDRRKALAAGFDLHVSKPATPDALTAAVRSLADQPDGRHPSSEPESNPGLHSPG